MTVRWLKRELERLEREGHSNKQVLYVDWNDDCGDKYGRSDINRLVLDDQKVVIV